MTVLYLVSAELKTESQKVIEMDQSGGGAKAEQVRPPFAEKEETLDTKMPRCKAFNIIEIKKIPINSSSNSIPCPMYIKEEINHLSDNGIRKLKEEPVLSDYFHSMQCEARNDAKLEPESHIAKSKISMICQNFDAAMLFEILHGNAELSQKTNNPSIWCIFMAYQECFIVLVITFIAAVMWLMTGTNESGNRRSDALKHNRFMNCINAMMGDGAGDRNNVHVIKSLMVTSTAKPGRTEMMVVVDLQRDGDGKRLPDFVAAGFGKIIGEIWGSNKEYQIDLMASSTLHDNKYNQFMFLSVSEIRSTEVCKFMERKLHHLKIWEDHDGPELHKKNHGDGDHGIIEASYAEAVCPELMQPPQRSRHGFGLVESDTPGRVSDDIGDPPGQQSVYIPPGDIRNETYRLSTFEHFPVACPISRKSLAQSGFYFTGFFDRVKCFSCGRTVERWEARDNPGELRWHKPDCQFPRGDPCGNIPINDLFNRLHTNPMIRQQQAQRQQEQVLTQTDPNTGAVIRTVRYPADLPERIRRTGGTFEIGAGNSVIIQSGPGSRRNPAIHIGNEAAPMPPRRWRMANVVSDDHRRYLNNLYLNRELDRLASFARWPVSRPNVAPAALARTGFFYLGDLDRTQCFSCGGVLRNWTLEDDAQEEHRTHFTSCAVVQGTENRNVAIPEQPESPEDRNRRYPCGYPANPHMRSEVARLETFDHRWPAGRVEATPASIAQAGFFFLGERDRVKCWYCNGGLQNWERDDIPWIEHAKWFPNCQFLLQNQGQVFVYRHLAMNPHLARPIIAKQEGATVDPAGGEVARGQDIPPGPNVRQPSPPPTIIDPQEEMRKKKLEIENVLKTSDVCKNVIAMGFSVDVVRRLIEEGIDAKNVDPENVYTSTSALLDDVMKKEEEQREAKEEEARNQASLMSSMHSAYSTNLSSLGAASLGPTVGSGRYNVSFYDDDEPMDDEQLYGSMNGPEPISISSTVSTSSITTAKKVQQNEEESQESLQEQLQKIEEERMCKICFSNVADMVFVPCSHMCCCMECTQAIRQCPVCRTKIEKAIKTYLK